MAGGKINIAQMGEPALWEAYIGVLVVCSVRGVWGSVENNMGGMQ